MLIAHIDILHSPDDGNFQLFSQAKRSLRSVMDMLLQPPGPTQIETPSTSAAPDLPAVDWMASEHIGFDGGFWYVWLLDVVYSLMTQGQLCGPVVYGRGRSDTTVKLTMILVLCYI